MTERLADVEQRIGSIAELHEIVTAMRLMAASRAQQAERAIGGMRAYADIVGDALARALALLPEPPAGTGRGRRVRRAVLAFCAEHGFAGAFSRHVLEAAKPAPGETLFVVGTRGTALCRELGLEVAWSLPMATHAATVTTTARLISEEIYRRVGAGTLAEVDIVFVRSEGGGRSRVRRDTVLPVDPGRPTRAAAAPPLLYLAPGALVERLVEEYLFALLAHAAMESFMSENAARVATMLSARRGIEEKLDALRLDERRLRQEEITTEMLDVVTGAEAARVG
jgi:F-type H+-transporting ATPase subunit gamma